MQRCIGDISLNSNSAYHSLYILLVFAEFLSILQYNTEVSKGCDADIINGHNVFLWPICVISLICTCHLGWPIPSLQCCRGRGGNFRETGNIVSCRPHLSNVIDASIIFLNNSTFFLHFIDFFEIKCLIITFNNLILIFYLVKFFLNSLSSKIIWKTFKKHLKLNNCKLNNMLTISPTLRQLDKG